MPEVTNNYLTGHPVAMEDKISIRLAVCGEASLRCIRTRGMAYNPSSVTLSHWVTSDRNIPYQKQPKNPSIASFVSPLHGLCLFQKSCKILSAFELKKKRA